MLIALLCIILLFWYYKVKKYDSFKGILLFLFGIAILLIKGIDTSVFSDNFALAGEYVLSFTLIMIIIMLLIGLKDKKPIKRMFLIFFLYIPFGILQQLFFQYLFTDSIFYLMNNAYISIILGAFYYMLFHPRLDLAIFTFVVGLGWSYLYLALHNVFWLGISHAILGTSYYVFMYKGDALKNKLNYFSKR